MTCRGGNAPEPLRGILGAGCLLRAAKSSDGLDEVPALLGGADADHRLHQHAFRQVSWGDVGEGSPDSVSSTLPALIRSGNNGARWGLGRAAAVKERERDPEDRPTCKELGRGG